MVKRIFNKRANRGMAVLMAAAMVGTMSPVSVPTQPTWTVQAATKVLAKEVAPVTVGAITYSTESLTLELTGDSVDTVYYAIATVKNFDPENASKYPKASAYEAVDISELEDIDLSWAKLTKDDTYLFVTTDTDIEAVRPGYMPLTRQNTKLKISYSGVAAGADEAAKTQGESDYGYLKLTTDKKTNPDGVEFADLEYRTETGAEWKDMADLTNLKRYSAKGATLQVRVKAVDYPVEVAPSYPPSQDATISTSNKAGNVAGKIFKVKIPAKAKSPKVTVNYLNQTVKFAKGMEVATGSALSDVENWPIKIEDSKDATKKLTTDLGYTGNKDMKIFVRTAAKGKKAPSKVTIVRLGVSQIAPEAVVATSGAISPNKTKGKVSIDYKTSYKKDSGIQLTNNTDKPLQFAIVKKSDVTKEDSFVAQSTVDDLGIADSKKVKWTNVAAGKTDSKGNFKAGTGTITKIGTAKISTVKAEDYVILYRIADKKAPVVSKIAVVDLPAVLEQDIEVKLGSTSTKEVSVTTDKAVSVDLSVELTNRVSTKDKYTVSKHKADETGKAGAKTSDITATIATSTDGTGTLKIKGSTKATGKYIVKVKCEGAEVDVVVNISGTASESTKVNNFGKAQKFTIAGGVTIGNANIGSEVATYATVVAEASAAEYTITPIKEGTFSFTYIGSDFKTHTVNVTIATDGTVTATETVA